MTQSHSSVTVARGLLKQLDRWAREASPEECCGLLFGAADWIISADRTQNVAEDRERRFEIDPSALIAAERSARAGTGPAIMGYFHSHPKGPADPSVTDAEMAAPDGRIWLIVMDEKIGGWRASKNGALHGRFDPVTLRFVDSALAM